MDDIKQESNQDTSSNSSTITGTVEGEENSATKKTQTKKYFKRKNLTVIFTGLIFLVTTIYTFFSFQQWQAMKDTLIRADTSNAITREALEFTKITTLNSDSSTRYSLTIADSSLNISIENIKTIRKNAKIELRAYLSIVDIYFSQFVVGKEIEIQMKLQNLGKTPATQIEKGGGTRVARRIGGGIVQTLDKVIQESDIKDIRKQMVLKYSLGATVTKTINSFTHRTLTQSDSIGIKSGDVIFFSFGEIKYRDIFEETHTLIYAYQYLATEGIFVDYYVKD